MRQGCQGRDEHPEPLRLDGDVHGIQRFGASAPYKQVQKELGFLPEDVVRHAEDLLNRNRQA